MLDVSNNRIGRAEGLHTLRKLEDLWLNDNDVQSTDLLQHDLASQKHSLTCIYLSGNPIVQEKGRMYRKWLKASLPALKQIDADTLQ